MTRGTHKYVKLSSLTLNVISTNRSHAVICTDIWDLYTEMVDATSLLSISFLCCEIHPHLTGSTQSVLN